MPTERTLTDAEREELSEAAMRGLERLGIPFEDVHDVLVALEAHVQARRAVGSGAGEEAFEIGALFAALLEMGLDWEMVEVTWPTGVEALAVAEMDRSLAVLPLYAVSLLYEDPTRPAELVANFERLASGARPPNLSRDAYAVLLP